MSHPNQRESIWKAIQAAWVRHDGANYGDENWGWASIGVGISWFVCAFLGLYPGLLPGARTTALVLLCLTQLAFYLGWATATRPRLPTIWEALIIQLILGFLPLINLFRFARDWAAGFDSERP